MVKINPNFGYWKTNTGSGSNLKEIQFTVTSDGVTILKSAAGYNLTYTNTDAKGLYLTSTLGQAFIVFIFPSNSTIFRPYIVKYNDETIGEINDNSGNPLQFSFVVDSLNSEQATITFNKN